VVVDRALAIPEAEVGAILRKTLDRFSHRHKDLVRVLEENYERVEGLVDDSHRISRERRQLIGAYFTHEYSVESAALSNPSMVLAPDQSDLEPGAQRFILSLRAIGEGHISSIEFRTGIIDSESRVTLSPVSAFVGRGARRAPVYDKYVFGLKLDELGVCNEVSKLVLGRLGPEFTIEELEEAVAYADAKGIDAAISYETKKIIHWLATSNYVVSFPRDSAISERILYPDGPTESHGMEDARFVRFVDGDSVVYYATYTAFDGFKIMPQLIETRDFVEFRIATLNGSCAQNKGIALFSRKIDGQYVALSRFDNENNYIMRSDEVRFWHESQKLQDPEHPWELMQVGNCGSPIETEAGWLVITHGVGPMRRYVLGALLLDLDDPARVIGRLREPLLDPGEDERDGYVPNVVYSCGGIVHIDQLVLPYGFADIGAAIALVPMERLLTALLEG
jgi:predicted GH43/DUF377 family glycosyl hydrolase